ncbi:unnamed protein product, partial [Schistosoma turkestanicum]
GTTRKSPFQLMYGRRPRLPTHDKTWPQQQRWNTTRLRTERRQAIRNVREKQTSDMQKSEQERKNWRPFEVGDQVKCRERKCTTGRGPGSGKLIPKWEGPYVVTERRGAVYTIQKGNKQKRVNASELQRWFQVRQEGEPQTLIKKTAVRRSERLRERLVKGGTSVVCATYTNDISSIRMDVKEDVLRSEEENGKQIEQKQERFRAPTGSKGSNSRNGGRLERWKSGLKDGVQMECSM